MRNIFSQTKDYVKQPKRNVFDLSFHNHGTYNFGYLYPVFCKETIPGDSFKIDPTFALRFLPTAFPVQTRVTANLHFFYVRNRNLWKNWKKFITHTDEVQFPYLDGTQDSLRSSELADYFGVPTTRVGNFGNNFSYNNKSLYSYNPQTNLFYSYRIPNDFVGVMNFKFEDFIRPNTPADSNYRGVTTIALQNYSVNSLPSSVAINSTNGGSYNLRIYLGKRTDNGTFGFAYILASAVFRDNHYTISFDSTLTEFGFLDNPKMTDFDDFKKQVNDYLDGSILDFYFFTGTNSSSGLYLFPDTLTSPSQPNYFNSLTFYGIDVPDVVDLHDLPVQSNVFFTSNSGSVRLSALPFRAYESIYNSFYRNDQNDPLMINGKPEFDVYVPNMEDGADSYGYKLYKRNWELDFLTSAVQSPQQGIAPLVGVSQQGDFTFVNKDSDGNVGYFTAKANISSDGNTITGFQLSDKVELQGLPTNPVQGADVPDEIKRGTVYTLNQMALAGISINDFRNVNSLQRWLETNIRRGYKYRDQIKSHYGVDISEKILDMPEFIGGISSPVFSSQVNQTVETESDPLGSYAGQLSLITDSKHSIKHYCDEHGFIIGILSIVPVPNYSQLLPKHFLKYNYLDYYFPEFAHIGMQPIDYREVCPVQQFVADPDGLNDTFGYQRPWYDYISSVDEVHGLFRTNLRNFVLNRQFDSKPMLNADFLQVDPEQLNDIFTVQDVEDKILGQIKFNVIAKRPIPKFGIPRLE